MMRDIDRRRFLGLSAFGAVQLAAPVPLRRAAGETSDTIVIIGAGLAGLRAALRLRAAGRNVLVLEARPHPGGRVHTIRDPFDDGLYAEAGAIRISGSHQTTLRTAREFGLTLIPFLPSDGAALLTIGGIAARAGAPIAKMFPGLDLHTDERDLDPAALLDHYVRDLPSDLADPAPMAASYARWRSYDEIAWPAWLQSRGASRDGVRVMTLGGDSAALSALYVLRQLALHRGSTHYFKIQGGMDLLPRAMASRIPDSIKYGAPVVRLEPNPRGVRVTYLEAGTPRIVVASRAVLAIPFSALREIAVTPSFSAEKQRAIHDLPYFPGTRFLIQSRSRFWREEGLNGYARTDQPLEIWDSTYDLSGPRGILGVSAGGDAARRALVMPPAASVAFAQGLVATSFPGIRTEFERGAVFRWTEDEWSRGAFAVFHPGQMSALMAAIPRSEGRVHFAGEHTSAWMGWMEGALRSGDRVASEILDPGEDPL